jgi:hypothetical protein
VYLWLCACALDCALHHAVKISMRNNGHWLSINKNTLNTQHQSHQINRKAAPLPANIVILFAVAVYCCKILLQLLILLMLLIELEVILPSQVK